MGKLPLHKMLSLKLCSTSINPFPSTTNTHTDRHTYMTDTHTLTQDFRLLLSYLISTVLSIRSLFHLRFRREHFTSAVENILIFFKSFSVHTYSACSHSTPCRQTKCWTDTEVLDRHTYIRTYIQTDRQADTHTEVQKDIQTKNNFTFLVIFAGAFIQSDLQPFIHTFKHRRGSQPRSSNLRLPANPL